MFKWSIQKTIRIKYIKEILSVDDTFLVNMLCNALDARIPPRVVAAQASAHGEL